MCGVRISSLRHKSNFLSLEDIMVVSSIFSSNILRSSLRLSEITTGVILYSLIVITILLSTSPSYLGRFLMECATSKDTESDPPVTDLT